MPENREGYDRSETAVGKPSERSTFWLKDTFTKIFSWGNSFQNVQKKGEKKVFPKVSFSQKLRLAELFLLVFTDLHESFECLGKLILSGQGALELPLSY